ncbi:MAG: NfeD family protein [Methanobacterium sp.]|jgi:membrane protein implicated in regulation of membrane protease activity
MVKMINIHFWIILAALCLLGEMFTTSFFLLWFGIGALVAAAFSYLGFDPVIQFLAFIITSTVLLGVSRPFAQKISKDSPKKAASDRLIGKRAVVIEEITSSKGGLVKVDGDIWRAVASCSIKNGETVTIEKINGVKLVVKPINEEGD